MAIKNRKKNKFTTLAWNDKLFVGSVYFILVIMGLIFLIPMLNIISSSFSSPSAVGAGKVTIFPIGFNFEAYKMVFANKKLLLGFGNTMMYTVLGTL